MTIMEIAFYIGIGIGNILIVTEVAKYGLLEIGIQRPINSRVILGLYIGTATFFIGGVMHKISGFNPENKYAIALVIGVPIFLLLVYRYTLLPPGLYDFNRARIRTNYWMLTSYRPGKILEEQGSNLKEFAWAKGAIRMFRKAIEAQSKGNTTRIVIDDQEVPWYEDDGNTTRIVTDENRFNVAVAHAELALLYRMMNKFDEAEDALKAGMKITEELLRKEPEKFEYLYLQNQIFFRMAELNHVQGKLEQAKKGYEESLTITKKLGNVEGVQTIEELLKDI